MCGRCPPEVSSSRRSDQTLWSESRHADPAGDPRRGAGLTLGVEPGVGDEGRSRAARIPRGPAMKIVVLGGTGLVGKKLVPILRAGGCEAIPASPSSGVNTMTGEGLSPALAGADVVVDVSNAPSWADEAVMEF